MRATSVFPSCTEFPAAGWLGRAGAPLTDAAAWGLALTGAAWLRYEFDFNQVNGTGLARVAAAAVAVLWLAGIFTHSYPGRHPVGSLAQALSLARINGIVCVSVFT